MWVRYISGEAFTTRLEITFDLFFQIVVLDRWPWGFATLTSFDNPRNDFKTTSLHGVPPGVQLAWKIEDSATRRAAPCESRDDGANPVG
jgi:hypothetical protein